MRISRARRWVRRWESEVFRAENLRELCHPESELVVFRSGSMRFNQGDLRRDSLIMLVRAEECDVALVVTACKEDVPAVRKHFKGYC